MQYCCNRFNYEKGKNKIYNYSMCLCNQLDRTLTMIKQEPARVLVNEYMSTLASDIIVIHLIVVNGTDYFINYIKKMHGFLANVILSFILVYWWHHPLSNQWNWFSREHWAWLIYDISSWQEWLWELPLLLIMLWVSIKLAHDLWHQNKTWTMKRLLGVATNITIYIFHKIWLQRKLSGHCETDNNRKTKMNSQ